MKNISTLIISLIIAAFSPTKSYAESPELADSLLWEVSGNGLTQSSYLTGTLHIMCEKDFGILPKVERAIKASDQLYLEVDVNDPNEMAVMQQMVMSDTLLTDTLSTEQQTTLNQALKELMGLSLEQVNKYSMSALLSLMLVKSVECPSIKVLDMELSTLAAAEGKTIAALETIKAQMGFMDKAFTDEYIMTYFEQMDEYKMVFSDMVEAFKAEDLNELMDLLNDKRFYNADVEHWLLKVRNNNWVAIMPEIMQKNSTVFAVGAGHLGGNIGVIQLLQEAGFTVKPVMN
ncbi:hypothetical protein MNBD_GAMMA02-267 [hydrothermal vent metagenome]|uniref:TraB/GumN family protein n=1 Tax=hydrothermal vent metagenome TaxID=652676 RepID=A0A3B0WA69_9ZZZZ